ncbi:MAG: ATP-binding cassette domain-containing protein [Ardenticatenaceae bacterium]|nr:ATP-binding cassette domain-containing protein [Ardenticatenaceae bacterium]
MDKRRGLGRLSPTPRLIAFVIISMLITFSSSWTSVIAAFVFTVVLLIAGRKYPRAALIAAFSAFVLTFLGHFLTAVDPHAVSFLSFKVSEESALKGLRLGLRLVAMILPAIAFIAVTPLHELLAAFIGLRVPPAVEMYLTIVLRYVDILWYDIQISMKAMAVRGVNWEGGIRDKIPAFRRLMLPLIFRILDHVDGQSLAIDNRGGVRVSREAPDISADTPALTMDSVYVRYDERNEITDEHALTDINLIISQGEAAVLLGRIGAGKTSAMLLSTGLIPKSTGRMRGNVTLFGHNTKGASLSLLGRLARIVFPSAVQGLVGLTVEGELAFSLRSSDLQPEDRHQAMVDALEIVGLDESFLPRQSLGLSGGEMQRVALASAIVSQPLLLALDDVTVQLDPVGKREVVAALQTLLGGRITTVMTDPYLELLSEVGSRFILLENGRITAESHALDIDTIQKASLRVPQMMRLNQRLAMALPTNVNEAIPLLKSAVNGAPPLFEVEKKEPAANVVRAVNLKYTYPKGPTAIKNLDVSFDAAEFVAILGSNGSGKTTLALLLTGAYKPTEGEILVNDESFDWNRHRGIMGYVFQEPVNQIVTMTVWDELAFGPQQLGWDDEAVKESVEHELERFNLSANDVPLHLTPANARKLAIAATLTMKPRLVVLDEPTNNLDESEVQQLMAHLKMLQASGTTVILITHEVEIACQYADRIMVMSNGRILVDGPTQQVMAQKALLAQSDVLVPPVVDLSLALWPDSLPALTVEELSTALAEPETA